MSTVTRSVSEFDIEVGVRLKAARLERGLSQSDVAKALGLTFQQVQKYERGLNRMPAAHYRKLHEIMGLDLADLLTGDSLGSGPSVLIEFASQASALELARAFVTLRPNQRQLVLQMAKELAAQEVRSVQAQGASG